MEVTDAHATWKKIPRRIQLLSGMRKHTSTAPITERQARHLIRWGPHRLFWNMTLYEHWLKCTHMLSLHKMGSSHNSFKQRQCCAKQFKKGWCSGHQQHSATESVTGSWRSPNVLFKKLLLSLQKSSKFWDQERTKWFLIFFFNIERPGNQFLKTIKKEKGFYMAYRLSCKKWDADSKFPMPPTPPNQSVPTPRVSSCSQSACSVTDSAPWKLCTPLLRQPVESSAPKLSSKCTSPQQTPCYICMHVLKYIC